MGTRADFYVGRGTDALWLGSIAWDGYPEGIHKSVLSAKTDAAYRRAMVKFFSDRDDVTMPERGWPWPWDNSQTTDFAYAFDDGCVWASCFGSEWFDPRKPMPEELREKAAVFPDMSSRQNIRWDKGSGIIVVSVPRHKDGN